MAKMFSINDFIGFYNISKSTYDKEDLQFFIDDIENFYLCSLLGDELSNLFTSDLTTGVAPNLSPTSSRFIKIFEPFCINDCDLYQSRGMKDMFLGLTYYEYTKEQSYQNTVTGQVRANNENSDSVMVLRLAERRRTRAVNNYRNIQKYICKNLSLYPEFEGIKMEHTIMGI